VQKGFALELKVFLFSCNFKQKETTFSVTSTTVLQMFYNDFGGPMKLAVLVDSREKKLIKKFQVPINVRQIVCGDIQIWEEIGTVGKCAIVIERKTWKDFAASLMDGRYKSQHNRMKEFQKTNGSLIYYCIEGRFPHFPPGKTFPHTNIKPDHLLARIDRWSFDTTAPVSVLYTKDPSDTCSRICKLLQTFSKKFITLLPQCVTDLAKAPVDSRFQNAESNGTVFSEGWLYLRGISTKTQPILAKNFRLAVFLTMNGNDTTHVNKIIDAFRLSGGRCGFKKSKNLLNIDSVRFFSRINGISRNRALAIIANNPLCLQQLAALELSCNGNWCDFSKSSAVEIINSTPGFRKNASILRKIFDLLVQDRC
jgi:ERCC4-type nuclease